MQRLLALHPAVLIAAHRSLGSGCGVVSTVAHFEWQDELILHTCSCNDLTADTRTSNFLVRRNLHFASLADDW